MDEKVKPKDLGDALLEREFADAVRRLSFEDLEKIPEMRDLMQSLIVERHERARISESLGTLPFSDIQRLFADYVEEKFDLHLHTFFGKLYDGIMTYIRRTMGARIELLEESMRDMKRSVLMASLHPHSWVEGEIVRACSEYLKMSPGMKAGLHQLYRFVAYDEQLPTPGATLTDKYQYLLRVLRSCERFREIDGFMFEYKDQQIVEDNENFASSDGYRDKIALVTLMNELSARRDEA